MDTGGGPQADDGGEQGLIIRTSFILSGAHQATQVSDWWWLMSNEQGSGSGLGWKPILLVTVGKCDSICPRVTTSISHPPGWKPVPLILWYLVLASSQQSYATITVPRTTSTVTQSIGLQPMQWWWIVDYAVVYCSFHQATRGADYWLLITDDWWLMTDCLHTENAGGSGGPQPEGFVGKQQLSSIGQQLKEKYFF